MDVGIFLSVIVFYDIIMSLTHSGWDTCSDHLTRNDYLKKEAIKLIELHTAFITTAEVGEQEIVLEEWLRKFTDFTLIIMLNDNCII